MLMNNSTDSKVPTAEGVVVDARQQPVQATQVQAHAQLQLPLNPDGTFQENERFGICRGCRRVFERSPQYHEGHVQYYRCPECNSHRLSDMIAASCIVS